MTDTLQPARTHCPTCNDPLVRVSSGLACRDTTHGGIYRRPTLAEAVEMRRAERAAALKARRAELHALPRFERISGTTYWRRFGEAGLWHCQGTGVTMTRTGTVFGRDTHADPPRRMGFVRADPEIEMAFRRALFRRALDGDAAEQEE